MNLLNKEFTRQLELLISPFLREQGFTQRGIDTYQRHMKPFVHCVWLQERSDKKALCVNLGVHLDFIPLPGMVSKPDLAEIVQPACYIMDRLKVKGQSDYWWPSEPSHDQVMSIKRMLMNEGIPFFDKYTVFPGVLESIKVDDIKSGDAQAILRGMTKKAMALFLARVYEFIGAKEKAVHFSEYGLEVIKGANPFHVRLIKKCFEDIIRLK